VLSKKVHVLLFYPLVFPCIFRFVSSLQISSALSHNTGLASTRDINRSTSNSKPPVFTTGRLLFQYSTDTAVQSYRSDTTGHKPVCVWTCLSRRTGHSNGYLRVLPRSRPVNSRPAKRPGCVNMSMLSCVPLLCPAITGTCWPFENRNVWTWPNVRKFKYSKIRTVYPTSANVCYRLALSARFGWQLLFILPS